MLRALILYLLFGLFVMDVTLYLSRWALFRICGDRSPLIYFLCRPGLLSHQISQHTRRTGWTRCSAFLLCQGMGGAGFRMMEFEPWERTPGIMCSSAPSSRAGLQPCPSHFSWSLQKEFPRLFLVTYSKVQRSSFPRSSSSPPPMKYTPLNSVKKWHSPEIYFSKKDTGKPNAENTLSGIYTWRQLFVLQRIKKTCFLEE